MKRPLTTEEKEMTQKGLDRNLGDMKKLKYNLDYNQALIDKQKFLRDWEDVWRQPERDRKDIEDKEIIKVIESEMKLKEEAIKIAKEHLSKGVEVKNVEIPTGVY